MQRERGGGKKGELERRKRDKTKKIEKKWEERFK